MNESNNTLAIIIGIIILHFVIGIAIVVYKISTAEKKSSDSDKADDEYIP